MTGTKTARLDRAALRTARTKNRLSQKALADLTGLGQPYISRLESGQRTTIRAASLRALADALEVAPRELVLACQNG